MISLFIICFRKSYIDSERMDKNLYCQDIVDTYTKRACQINQLIVYK